jgi:hypothetical protein
VALDLAFDDSTAHFIVPRDEPGRIGRDRCGPGRRFRVGAQICMSIRAIDLAGNRSDAATLCTTVGGQIGDTARTASPPLWPARRHYRPEEQPDGWLALTMLTVLRRRRVRFARALRRARRAVPCDVGVVMS